jgi:hypothetical protein
VKNLVYLIVFILFTFPSNAQSIKVRKLKKLHVTHEAWFPSFGNNSREVLLTGRNYKGLTLYNTRTRKESVISDEQGAGSKITFRDRNEMIYRVTTITNGKSEFEYKSFNLDDKTHSVGIKTLPGGIQVSVKGKQIELYSSGEKINTLAPVGNCYYIWASLSPDEKKILFTAVGKGTYIADLEGNVLSELGYLNAPSWMNNEWVVGMDDEDDGEIITSSQVIAIHVPSVKKVNITNGIDEIAMYPKTSKDAERVVFHNPKGEVFIVKIRIKNPD